MLWKDAREERDEVDARRESVPLAWLSSNADALCEALKLGFHRHDHERHLLPVVDSLPEVEDVAAVSG